MALLKKKTIPLPLFCLERTVTTTAAAQISLCCWLRFIEEMSCEISLNWLALCVGEF
jgi:hypothetical protein